MRLNWIAVVCVALCFVEHEAQADDGVLMTTGAGIAFGDPELDDSGFRAVIERTYYEASLPGACGFASSGRIVVLDLEEHCGHDVLREVHGYGTDPSISADGANMVWRVAGPGVQVVYGEDTDLDGGFVLTPDDTADQVDHLQLAPDSSRVFYWRRSGLTHQVVRRAFAALSPVELLDQALYVDLNDHHPVDANGTVYYTKLVGASREIYKVPAGSAVPEVVSGVGLTGDKSAVAASSDGTKIAFIVTVGGVANAFAMTLGLSPVALTANTSASVVIRELDISANGKHVVFSSNGDFADKNLDGSMEVFRVAVDDLTVMQVTNLEIPFPAEQPYIEGVSTSATGAVIMLGRGTKSTGGPEPCLVADQHTERAYFYSIGTTAPTTVPTTALVMPPFDVKSSFPGLTLGCEATGSSATCRALVREAGESSRLVLLMPHWEVLACGFSLTGQPVPMVLPLNEQATFEDVLATPPGCSGLSGTFTLIAVSPDVAVADRAVATALFTLP